VHEQTYTQDEFHLMMHSTIGLRPPNPNPSPNANPSLFIR